MRIIPSFSISIQGLKSNNIYQLANKLIDKPNLNTIVSNHDGKTDDIITSLLNIHPKSVKTVSKFAPYIKGNTEKETLNNIWNFVKNSIEYRLDPLGEQKLKTAARTFYDKFGDCKSYSLFIGSLLENLKIPFKYRFVGYSSNNIPTHVYVVAGNNYIIDCCLPSFNVEKNYNYKKDIDMTKISELSGIGRRKRLTPEQIIAKRKKIARMKKIARGVLMPHTILTDKIKNKKLKRFIDPSSLITDRLKGNEEIGRRKRLTPEQIIAKRKKLARMKKIARGVLMPHTLLTDKIKNKKLKRFIDPSSFVTDKLTGCPDVKTVGCSQPALQGLYPTSRFQHGDLALRIARQRTEIEKDIVEGLRGIGSLKSELYNNRLEVINDAIEAINGENPEAHIDWIVSDMGTGVYHKLSAVSEIGDIGERKKKRTEEKQKRKKIRTDKVKSGKKPLFQKIKKAGQKFVKGAAKFGKKLLKVVTAPQRLLVKGILEVGLPKIAPLFLYLFISDPKILAKLPAKVLRKRKKAEKIRNFIVNVIGMKEAHFMGIVRNGIMKKYKMSPENVIAKAMTGKLNGIYGLGNQHSILSIGCSPGPGAVAVCCSPIAGIPYKIPMTGGYGQWLTSNAYQMDGIGQDPYSAIIKSALDILNKLMDLFKKKKDKDILPDSNDVSEPSNDFDVVSDEQQKEIAEDIKKQKPDDIITDNSIILDAGGDGGGSGGGSNKSNDDNVQESGTNEEGNVLPKNGGSTSKGWS